MQMCKNNFANSWMLCVLFCGTMFTLLLSLSLPGVAQTQSQCDTILTAAEVQYNASNFKETIDLLLLCLPIGFTDEQKIQAYRIISLAHLGKKDVNSATGFVTKLLDLSPNYEPDPDQDPPQFVSLIQEVKAARGGKKEEPREQSVLKKGGKKWLYIGGGVAAVGGIVAAIISGGGDGGGGNGGVFPLPPGRPR